jgi:hypothetical protein
VWFRYEGAFSLKKGPGGGTMMRLSWKDAAGKRHFSQDIVTYPNQGTINVDLRTSPASAVSEDGAAWAGMIHEIRIDPNEDAGERCWHLDHV